MRFLVRVPVDRTFVVASVAVVAYLVGCWNGRWDGRQRGIDGRTRSARMLAAVFMVKSVIGSPSDAQWLRNRLVEMKMPSSSRGRELGNDQ